MRRLALFSVLLLTTGAFASNPEEILRKRYKDYNTLIVRGDQRGTTQWVSSNCEKTFTYTSYQKNKFSRTGYLSSLLQQIDNTRKVLKSTTTVRSIKKSGRTFVVTVASDFKGIVSIDSRQLTLTDQGVTLETWEPVGADWKLKTIVQVNADTQMQQNEGS